VHTNDPTATITSVITATLDVPGATLHYQVRGTGPMMLMICRGISDADLLAHLAQRLADQFTIGTYDRRGNSRSPPAGPPVPQRIEVHADDAHRWSELIEGLLDSTGRRAGPAMVIFGAAMGMSDDAGVTEILRTAATALTAARAATRVTREPSTGGRGDDGAPAGQH
jgi:pimeloyl-ACP methyl ester carboxylesterase